MPMTSDSGRGLTRQELDTFLAAPRIAKIATINAEGWPQISPVWYAWTGSSFLVISKERAGLVRNLHNDNRCAVLVDNTELPFVRVSVQGIAEFLGSDFDYMLPMKDMVLRYFGDTGLEYAQATFAFPRVPFRVLPIKIATWNGAGYDRTFRRDTSWRDFNAV